MKQFFLKNNLVFSPLVPSISPGPCSPSNVSVSTECGASTVSWSPVSGAETYIATATRHNGLIHTCNSSSAHSCPFTDLHCGGNYSVSVVAFDRGCHSEPSSAVDLKTGEKMFSKDTVMLICFLSGRLEVNLIQLNDLTFRYGWMHKFSKGSSLRKKCVAQFIRIHVEIQIMFIYILFHYILEPS